MYHVERNSVRSFDFSGIEIHDLTAESDGNGASVAFLRVPPGAEHAPARSHRCEKYYVALAGSPDFRVGDQRVQLSRENLLVIEKTECFANVNRGNETAELLLMHVPPFDLQAEEFTTNPELIEALRP